MFTRAFVVFPKLRYAHKYLYAYFFLYSYLYLYLHLVLYFLSCQKEIQTGRPKLTYAPKSAPKPLHPSLYEGFTEPVFGTISVYQLNFFRFL